MARLVAYGIAGVPNEIMGYGPVPASQVALKKAGLTLAQMDVIESNEAFAAQSLAVAKGLEFDLAKVNVNGGAIALGHPVGASGTVIITKALYELERIGGKYAMATMCIGGGQGITTIWENKALHAGLCCFCAVPCRQRRLLVRACSRHDGGNPAWRNSRQINFKAGAVVFAAEYADAAPKQSGDQVMHNIQPQPRAALAEFGGEEWVEDSRQVFRRDANAIITDSQLDAVVFCSNRDDADNAVCSAVKCMQYGIVDQVDDDLSQWAGIAVQAQIVGDFGFYDIGCFFQRRVKAEQDFVDDFLNIELSALRTGLIDGYLFEAGDQLRRAP
jgi:hypothetical protein